MVCMTRWLTDFLAPNIHICHFLTSDCSHGNSMLDCLKLQTPVALKILFQQLTLYAWPPLVQDPAHQTLLPVHKLQPRQGESLLMPSKIFNLIDFF